MNANKLEMKDFKEFETCFKQIKEEILDNFIESPPSGVSEDIIQGF